MPSAGSWWWIGISAAGAAAVGGGVLIWRGRRQGRKISVARRPPATPPTRRPEGSKPTRDCEKEAAATKRKQTVKDLCRQWTNLCEDPARRDFVERIGVSWWTAMPCASKAPQWRKRHFGEIVEAIQTEVDRSDESWYGDAQRDELAFKIAKRALHQTCPDVPLPKTQADVDEMRQKSLPVWARGYWDGLWVAFFTNARSLIDPLKVTRAGP